MGNAAAKQRAGGRYVHWDTAVPPAPPGKPHLVPGTPHTQPDLVIIRWEPPINDGGSSVTGYVVEHRRTGSPHWVRATPQPVAAAELVLSGLEPGWRYQFRVSAMNDVGLSDPGDVSEPLTVALNRSTTSAPYFLQELRDVVALENETAEFHVVFRGTPTPKIAWYKDGFEIFSSRRMRIVTDGDKSSLVIFQTTFSDEGDIKCTATNRVGHVVSKAKLRLEAPPRVRLPRRYEEGLLFEKGEVIRLKVSVAGRPLPRVTWLHNGEPVPFGGRYDVTHTEKGSALRVADARRADRGEYAVRASSRLGDDTASFLVTVTDRPMPPGRALLKGADGRWVDLEWTEPDDDGGCKIGNYIVEYYRIGWNVWLKAATSRQLSTRLEDLIEGSEYKFRVKAENPYGVSDPGEESDVVFVPDPRRGLMEPPARKSATLPANVTLNQTLEPLPQTVVEINKKKSMERKPLMPIGNQDISDMRKKRDFPDDVPPPIPPKSVKKAKGPLPPQRHQKSATLPAQISTPPAMQQTQQKIEEFQQPSWTNKKLLNPASPLTPREEDDSILHGSSELMLVLLPEGEGEGVQKEKGSGEPRGPAPSFEADGEGEGECEESVPPPMSLSAPELGSGDALMGAPLRNAVSSSELLHERAMARFYQSVAAEEAQKAMQRRHSLAASAPAPPSTAVEDRRRSATPPPTVAVKEPPEPLTQPMEEESADAMEDYDVEMEEPYEDSLEEEEELLEMGAPEPPPFRARLSFEEDEEEETYHPRTMTGVWRRSLTPERDASPPPTVPPHARAPPPARSPPPPPSAFVPKPILKKPRSPSPPQARSLTPTPPPRSPSPRPPRSPATRSPPPRSPSPPSAYPGLELPERPQSPGLGPPCRPPSRQEVKEEQEALAQALDDHYGGIIRDISRSHRPPKRLFTNTAELKAAVEHQPRPLFDAKAKTTPASQPPPRKKEPTPQPEEPPPPPKKRRRWWSWIFGGDEDEGEEEEEEEALEEEEAASVATAARGSPAPAEASPSPTPAQQPATPMEVTAKVAEKKARTSLEYVTDLSLFTVAFWLYVFGDELLAIPILLLMVYRQLREAISNRLPKFMRPS